MPQDELLYVGQKAFIEKDGKVLVLLDEEGRLCFPGGKIQEGERDFTASLKREVREETKLDIDVGDPFCAWHIVLGPPHRHAGKRVYLVGFRCQYRSGEVVLGEEHREYRWVDYTTYQQVDDGSDFFAMLAKYFTR